MRSPPRDRLPARCAAGAHSRAIGALFPEEVLGIDPTLLTAPQL